MKDDEVIKLAGSTLKDKINKDNVNPRKSKKYTIEITDENKDINKSLVEQKSKNTPTFKSRGSHKSQSEDFNSFNPNSITSTIQNNIYNHRKSNSGLSNSVINNSYNKIPKPINNNTIESQVKLNPNLYMNIYGNTIHTIQSDKDDDIKKFSSSSKSRETDQNILNYSNNTKSIYYMNNTPMTTDNFNSQKESDFNSIGSHKNVPPRFNPNQSKSTNSIFDKRINV